MENKDISTAVNLRRIKASAIYKLLFIGLGITMLLFSFISGLMVFFGYDTVKWGHNAINGFLAIPAALLIGLIMTIFVGTLTCLGLWIYNRFYPLQVKVID